MSKNKIPYIYCKTLILIFYSFLTISAKKRIRNKKELINKNQIDLLVGDLNKIYSKNNIEGDDLIILDKKIHKLNELLINSCTSIYKDLSKQFMISIKNKNFYLILSNIIKKKHNMTINEFLEMRNEGLVADCIFESLENITNLHINISDLLKFKPYYNLINNKMHKSHSKLIKSENLYEIMQILFDRKDKKSLIKFIVGIFKKSYNATQKKELTKEELDSKVKYFKKVLTDIGLKMIKDKDKNKEIDPAYLEVINDLNQINSQFNKNLFDLNQIIEEVCSKLNQNSTDKTKEEKKKILLSKLKLKNIIKYKSFYFFALKSRIINKNLLLEILFEENNENDLIDYIVFKKLN
ncbi:MAG: hypothetical protein GY830_05960 [Bacteroidetes bacterium]|nr:hypothetical protein [Bacteroidota bacterium]